MANEATAQAPAYTIQMAEAGFSINVKMLDPHGQEVMITFRAPLASNADTMLDYYVKRVGKLLEAGWQPLKAASRSAAQDNGGAANGAPRCNTHNRAMKASNHGGFYCTAKLGDGSYCKEKG